MECARDRTVFPSRFSACGSQLANLELAHLVGQGLARPGDVAVDLVFDLVARERGIFFHVGDRLVAGPVLVVNSGVDDQSRAAKRIVVKPAKLGVGVRIESDLAGEPFAVKCPALVERREVEIAAEWPRLAFPADVIRARAP